jgi:uncharacterized repeat protein (TIGR01451 family)
MRRQAKLAALFATGFISLLWLAAGSALAVSQSPKWTVTSVSAPTNLAPGDETGAYLVTVTNTGGAASDGTPVTITDELPAGLSLDPAGASGEDGLAAAHNSAPGANFSCLFRTCTYTGTVVPDDALRLTFPVDVSASPAPVLTNVVRVSGGGAPDAAMQTPTVISQQPASFGISPGGATTALSTDQAGAHADLTTSIAFNTVLRRGALAGDPKDTTDELPPGFAGDLVDTPSCSLALFAVEECPIATQVGVTSLSLELFRTAATKKLLILDPVYNLSPNPGAAAKLGFKAAGIFGIQGDVSVRPSDYGLRTAFQNTNETEAELDQVSLTVWGVPADPIHDPLRWNGVAGPNGHFGASSQSKRAPFLTNPTSCGSKTLQAGFTTDSWEEPGHQLTAQMPFGPIVGCDRLTIEPEIEAQPTSTSAYSPTGLDVEMKIPQTYDNPDGLATSHLRDVVVTLPEGMSLNPSAGSGLGSCTEAQFAYEGSTAAPAPGLGCPNESKIGTVHVKSPSLAEEASGSLFVATPFENRFGSLLALYLIARIPNRGVVVAAAGEVHSDPLSGQLTTSFRENPQLPFSEFNLGFRQGATSPLVTPPICGSFSAVADLTPWSVPDQHHLPPIPPFQITSGVHGGPCPGGGTPPFHPLLHAGSYSNQAGAYSPFYIRLAREDGEQEITHFSIKLPLGLVGKLAGIPFCSDAAIAQAKSREHEGGGSEEQASPSCPAASEVGHTEVEAGVGTVLASAPGKVYLAGPYHGSNLSIVAITAARVGPFDLGTVVIRFALKIDPETAEVFVDSQGSDPLPHIIDGIPTHLRNIRTYMDKPEFILNPTSCDPTFTASTVLGSGKDFVSAADDNPVTTSSFFQVANCASLAFKPKLALSLKGATRRGANPALKAVLTYPHRPTANIASAQVTLPPSEFLDNAHIGTVCTRVQFKEGVTPGEKCPANSIYGHAKALSPIFSEALEGPVYLRSTGTGPEARVLPDLVAALHNRQVDIALVGFTEGTRGGGIRNTFKAVPDAPVTRFTLELSGAKKGLLKNSKNLCARPYRADALLTGHNGKVFRSKPVLAVKCPKKGKGKKHGKRHAG